LALLLEGTGLQTLRLESGGRFGQGSSTYPEKVPLNRAMTYKVWLRLA
jgi:hypothetical protein